MRLVKRLWAAGLVDYQYPGSEDRQALPLLRRLADEDGGHPGVFVPMVELNRLLVSQGLPPLDILATTRNLERATALLVQEDDVEEQDGWPIRRSFWNKYSLILAPSRQVAMVE